MHPKALFVVRATVEDPGDRAAFDAWYGEEHLAEAVAAFGASRGWRCWSVDEPAVHVAYYEFDTVAAAAAVPTSPALAGLIAKFDSRWQGRVTRSRELLKLAGSGTPGAR